MRRPSNSQDLKSVVGPIAVAIMIIAVKKEIGKLQKIKIIYDMYFIDVPIMIFLGKKDI